jgi:pimeloyl-ACP methyl ester carboxylesterase
MGAMQSLAAVWLHPDRVGKVVSISGSARSSPGSVAMRYAQRSGMSWIFLCNAGAQELMMFYSAHGGSELE